MGKLVDTKTISHMKVTIPIPWNKNCDKKVTYYIGQIPVKGLRIPDLQIHSKVQGDDDGYGGSVLEFLMDDGTIEKVKGPYHCDSYSHTSILFDILKEILWLTDICDKERN